MPEQCIVSNAPTGLVALADRATGVAAVSNTSLAASVQAPAAFVQSKSSTNSTSVTLDSPTTAGNLLAVVFTWQMQQAALPSPTGVTLGGSADNFAQSVGNDFFSGVWHIGAYVWADESCAGGQTAISVSGTNFSSAPFEFGGILAMEFTPGTLDQVQAASTPGPGTTWTTGQTPATAAADELYVGAFNIWNVLTGASADPTWTTQQIGSQMLAGYKLSTDPAGSTPQFSGIQENQANDGSAVIATFEVSPPPYPVGLAIGNRQVAGVAIKNMT